jgi:DNA-binding Lrp family transcriptional regulator
MKFKIEQRVSLTPRDIYLLEELYRNVALSLPQISRKVFPERAKPPIINRLARLDGFGVIERWRIPVLNSRVPGPGIFVVYQITKKGIEMLRNKASATELRDKPVRLHGHSIHHDLLLVDVLDALGLRFPGAAITNGKFLEALDGDKKFQPDALLVLPGGGERWAVELELNAKSERRYREIVLRYRLSRSFDRVLYVTGSSEVTPKLARVLGKNPGELCNQPFKEKFLAINVNALLLQARDENPIEPKTNQIRES